jgi:hypothetical protein
MTDGHAGDTETPREELSRRLKAHMAAAGMSTYRAHQMLEARGIKSSQPKVSRTVNGRTAADPEFVYQLCVTLDAEEGCEITPAERYELVELARRVKAGNRRLVISRDEGAQQRRMGRYTRNARLIRAFIPNGMVGLAQTEPYVRRIMHEEAGVRARLANQAILDEPGREFRWIFTEGALGFTLLDPPGSIAQLDRLYELSQRPNIRVGIIPFGQASPVFPIHFYELFDDTAMVTGGESYGLDLDDPDDIAAYVMLTDQLERITVWDGSARALIREAADRYRKLS